ncbi:helix-turn-helix domain-containing protein [Bdellovibrio sp. HCB337]|uniref:helix-turn-helix domain-containing protein n=1 Tax=Bdellovibrio sp. HCB337 TaxID=3394358 RepID=UPI0039A7298A
MSLNKNLQIILKQKNWNLSRLAKETGINKSTLHAWTVGRGNIKLEYLRKVAVALEVSVHKLAYGEPDPFEEVSEEILNEIFSGDVRVTLHRIERRRAK